MAEFFVPAALVLLGLAIIVTSVALLRLQQAFCALKAEHEALTTQVQRNNEDIAGLCSAAVAVDRRLATNELTLSQLADSVFAHQTQSVTVVESVLDVDVAQSSGYDRAIKMIRQGSDVDDLVKRCGLTRDEAMLLIRLHGR